METKNYIGIDYHKKYTQITVVNARGEIQLEKRVLSEKEDLQRVFRQIKGPKEAVMEATYSWDKLYNILEEEVDRLILAHPLKVKAIASAKIKNDKIDSKVLAQLLRADLIPEAYIPSQETRLKKNILRQRMFFVRLRTMLKNRVHSLVDRNNVPGEELKLFSDLFGKKGKEYLRNLEFSDKSEKILLHEQLNVYEVIEERIKLSDKLIEDIASKDERVARLRSIPGIGKFFSVLILYEIDNVARFTEPRKLFSYAGLVPSLYSSGEKSYNGKLTREGNRYLRWACIEAVVPAISSSLRLKMHYEKVKLRNGANAAKVAVARKILELVWIILKKKCRYEERTKINKVESKAA